MKSYRYFVCFLSLVLLITFHACAQPSLGRDEAFDYGTTILSLEQITETDKLNAAIKRLNKVYLNKNQKNYKGADTVFTILHMGDSHIQGNFFTGAIRKQLQYYFGNAGQGVLFPYALAQSYGPKGVEVKVKGKWKGAKTMTQNLKYNLGLSGYGAFINTANCSLRVSFNEKLDVDAPLNKLAPVRKINIWHSVGQNSFSTQLDEDFRLIDSKLFPSGWGVSTFLAEESRSNFTIKPTTTDGGQSYYGFYGFELLPLEQRGINYYNCGVVGAQFSHLIQNASFALEQIKYLKPDILIFSFGTNEAYNRNFNASNYIMMVENFITEIQKISPNTAVIFTTAPDTRSRGKIPPHQTDVNQALKSIAKNTSSAVYDLNAAMGGWGSMITWYRKQLSIGDKLHFNTDGYAIQGTLLSFSLLQLYNKQNARDTLDLNPVRRSIDYAMRLLVKENAKKEINDTTTTDTLRLNHQVEHTVDSITPQKKETQKLTLNKAKKKFHVVKKGDTLSHIARIYHVSTKSVAKANNISLKSLLRQGQKLQIPAR